MSAFDDKTPEKADSPEVLAYRLAQAEKRLNTGAAAFGELRADMADTRTIAERKMTRVIAGLGISALAIAVAVGVLLNRVDDTAKTQEKQEEKLEDVRSDVQETKLEQVRMGNSIEGIQKTLDEKLDKAIGPPVDPISGTPRKPR